MMAGGFCFACLGDRISRRPTVIAAACRLRGAHASRHGLRAGLHPAPDPALSRRFRHRRYAAPGLGAEHRVRAPAHARHGRQPCDAGLLDGHCRGCPDHANMLEPRFGWQGSISQSRIGTLACAGAVSPASCRIDLASLGAKVQRPDLIAVTQPHVAGAEGPGFPSPSSSQTEVYTRTEFQADPTVLGLAQVAGYPSAGRLHPTSASAHLFRRQLGSHGDRGRSASPARRPGR